MDRKKFLKKSAKGLGTIIAFPTIAVACSKESTSSTIDSGGVIAPTPDPNCAVSPASTAGPFFTKSPFELVRENIIGDREGVPLVVNLKIENTNNNCQPLKGVVVDLWHCDAKGNYSEYSGQLEGDFTAKHFLRGRQTTGDDGIASFVSIYPGWYPGRAPHLHIEIRKSTGESLLITQTAFPENVSNAVYANSKYKGNFDTSNTADGVFRTGLDESLATSVTGSVTDGYTLTETIKVAF